MNLFGILVENFSSLLNALNFGVNGSTKATMLS